MCRLGSLTEGQFSECWHPEATDDNAVWTSRSQCYEPRGRKFDFCEEAIRINRGRTNVWPLSSPVAGIYDPHVIVFGLY
jgi:hypothetical protein